AASAVWRYLGVKLAEGRNRNRPAAPRDDDGDIPDWLDPDLVVRTHLRERVRDLLAPANDHPWHPRAIVSFGTPVWQTLLASLEAERTQGLEWRHPSLDLRVLEFLLSVPPVPWARRKLIMRQAMAGRLPAELLARRKTPLVADPLERALARKA